MSEAYNTIIRMTEIGNSTIAASGVSAKTPGIPPRTSAQIRAELKFSIRRPTPHVGHGNPSRFAANIETTDRQEGQRGYIGSNDH